MVGDDRQLTHISNLGADSDDRLMATVGISAADTLSYRHSAFDRAKAVAGQSAFTLLDRHYRCVPEVMAFCNEHFYGGQLKVERPAGETRYRASSASKSALNTQEAQRALLEQLLHAVARTEADASVRALLEQVEIGTIHTFQGGQHQLMLFSTVVAQGARPGTVRWFEENRNLLNVAISRARDLLIVVGHRATLEQAGGILAAMVTYADGLARPSGVVPPLPPGLQPERLGLRPSEAEILRSC